MRYQYIDILRGVCIVMMVAFHLNYSLVHIFSIEILNFSKIFWYMIGKISAIGFITIAGISYFLASKKYTEGEVQNKYYKYAGIFGVIALGITLGTYIMIPDQLILFGILHFFALSFLFLPIVTRDNRAVFLTIAAIFGVWKFTPGGVGNDYSFPLGFVSPSFASADYYPLIPYFGVLLSGYLAAMLGEKYGYMKLFHTSRSLSVLEKFLSFAGKKSLIIYIIHQPIIIIIVYAITRITS